MTFFSKEQLTNLLVPTNLLNDGITLGNYATVPTSIWDIINSYLRLNPGTAPNEIEFLATNGIDVVVGGHFDDNFATIIDSYTFSLGGSLNQNTTIYGGGNYSLAFNSLSEFTAYTSNDVNIYSEVGSIYLTSNEQQNIGAQAILHLGPTGDISLTGVDILLSSTSGDIELNMSPTGLNISSLAAINMISNEDSAIYLGEDGTLVISASDSINIETPNLIISDLITVDRLRSVGNALTIVGGSALGTSPTAPTITGSNMAHTITTTTGTSCVGSNATIATITFGNTWPSAPRVILVPANANAAALNGVTQVFSDSETTTTYIIKSGSTALTDSTQYKWKAHVIG